MCKKLVCLVSVVLVLGLVVDASAVLKKGPYLLWPGTNTEMTVLWQLNSTMSCTLEWGLNTNYSTGSVQTSEYGGDNQHKYTISGLSPGTKYFYRVTAGAEQPTGTFRAAPSSSATAVKFLAYGDTRTNPDKHDLVAEEVVNTYQADSSYQTMVLFTGDYTSSHSETAWTNEFFPTSYTNIRELQANLPIQGALGNHELFWSPGGYKTESNITIPPKYFPFPFEAWSYWSFDYGPALIIIADQYAVGTYPGNTIGSTQLTWIENELSTSNREWKFIVLHEPGYGAGQSGENSEVMNYIQPLCEEYGVDIVFAGHHHHYARCVKNGIKHLTLGGGGAPLSGPEQKPGVEYREMTYHFAKIEIDGTTLNFEARKPDGSLVDAFSLYHAVDNDPPTPDPMTWSTMPYSTGTTSIAMVATTASDPGGVEYFFDCVTAGGHDSSWQDETSYEDINLDPGTEYCYQVKARDKSPAQNETAYSTPTRCATTDAVDTDPPTPDPMEWLTVPYSTGATSIAMVATTASDSSGVEYFFDCVTAGGHDSSWQDQTSYEDIDLQSGTEYCYEVKARDKSPAQNETAYSTPTRCATTDAPCTASTTHVESIVLSVFPGQKGKKFGRATVTIYNNCGDPVSGADVDGTFSGDFNETILNVTTNGSGVAVFTTTAQVKKPSFTFCVDDVTHSTLTYDANDNVETCDSYIW